MIDIHCHILPGVDDGPKTIEESLDMIKLAYGDGIREIIATPHFNHPFEFESDKALEQFKLLKEKSEELYDDFKLHLGAEVYITASLLKDMKRDIKTISDSRYMLIEFNREVDPSEILDAVHELKLKGYIPIVAHIEMYRKVLESPEIVKSIRKDGGYIQITGSSILGKQGKEVMSFIKKLLKDGDVDFIASDGHSLSKRRPVLRDVYLYIEENYGEKLAKKVFIENPSKIIKDEEIKIHIKQNTKKLPKRSSNLVVASITAAVILVGGLFIGVARQITPSDAQYTPTLSSSKSSLENIDNKEITLENIDDVESDDKNLKTASNVDALNSQDIAKENIEVSKEEIHRTYREKLESLQTNTEAQLDAIVNEINEIRSTVSDENERKREIDKRLDKIGSLEDTSQNQVYSILYDMQNELEKHRFEVSEVQNLRDEYHDIKNERMNDYINKLKN